VAAGGVALFLSMEMPRNQVNDRNISAIGHIPLGWLKNPRGDMGSQTDDERNWKAMADAFGASRALNLYIDDQTGLHMMSIRAKARRVKRKAGALDVLVIDQLSFITGGKGDRFELTGEYTRGLVALAKELDIVVLLLCQLNRKCEERPNKRPMLSDLAQSGSIEQDGAYVMFLYRDQVYNPDSPDKGVAEIIVAKQRQGRTGTAHLAYVEDQTRFEDLARSYQHPEPKTPPATGRGFD
jgi:replicative DNA helicase